jgi:hypothetical protein
MTVTRGIAAAAMLAGLAAGTATTAWAAPTISGHYIETDTSPSTGQSTTNDWYFTPCGDGCASAALTPGGKPEGQARLVNGQWNLDTSGESVTCRDGTVVPNASSSHYSWDPNTLAGTVQITYTVPTVCGHPATTGTVNMQLKKAP